MDLTSPLPFRHQREVHMPKPLEISASLLPFRLEGMASETDSLPSSISPHTSIPPRSPLPPHKLAKIANALGVNTPMPAFFRSPSPSGSSFRTPSKYLLHVVPPAFLPTDEDDDGSDPDGASSVSASSYRSQFRRGTLIPLYPTLHSQLGAIAREYNLPSTGGLVLYLVHSSQDGVQDGPRISEDVWKLLWHKALQAERQDSQPRSVSALALPSGRSTPSSPYAAPNRDASQHLSPTSRFPPSPLPYPTPSPSSTPSLDVHNPLFDKDNASTSDLGSIISEITPNPFLPILAKVEFDIDRRKAGWFDAWIHAKRDRSRWRTASDGGKLPLALPDHADSRTRLRRFPTDTSTPSESSDYIPLDDGEGDKTAVHEDKATIVLRHKDPLEDVFGNDGATWGKMHSARQRKPTGLGISSPYPELIIPPGGEGPENEDIKIRDEDEVRKIWDENKRPRLAVNPPELRASPRKSAPPPLNIRSNTESKRQQPANPDSFLPYLNNRSPSDSGSSTQEAQNDKRVKRRTGMVFGDLEVKIVAEPEEMTEQDLAHRSSQIVMKHKLDQLEKQLAQLSPRQLRDHKQTRLPSERVPYSPLRSAPPGEDRFNLSPPTHVKGARSLNPMSRHPDASIASTRQGDDRIPLRKDSLGAVVHSQPARLQEHKRAQSSQSSSGSSSLKSHLEQPPGLTRPSAPRSPLPSPSSPPATRPSGRPQERTPPQLTVKRASAAQRKGDVSEETKARKFSDGQEHALPPLPKSPLDGTYDGLVIPLSPDPFSKLPVEDLRSTRPSIDSSRSNESRPPSRLQQGTVLPSSVPENVEAANPTSRFSADSEQGVEQLSKQRRRSNSVMSVRGIRNLWRKSTVTNKPNEMPLPPVPTEPTPSLPIRASSSSHSRENSSLSQRSTRPPTERRRSATLRPDSGADPFQFDNASIYKSASSSSLASAVQAGSSAPSPSPAPASGVGANHASGAGSIVRSSKGILKGWPGNVIQLDAEARRARQPTPERTVSTASMQLQLSDAGDPAGDPRPSSPPDVRSAAAARRKTKGPTSPIELPPLSHSLPTSGMLSKLSSSTPSFTSSLDDSHISHLSEFEMVSPPMRSTPSASYNGEVF